MDNYLLAILVLLCIYIIYTQYHTFSNFGAFSAFSAFSVPGHLNSPAFNQDKIQKRIELRNTERNGLHTLEPQQLNKSVTHEQSFSNPDDNTDHKTASNYDYNNMVEKQAVDEDVVSNHKKYVSEANTYQGARVFGELDMSQQISWIGLRRPEGVYQSKDALFITEVDQETLGRDRARYLI